MEAISKKQQRIPYRESKMTRILSLGQNNGFTVMILNLAPVKAYHLDTLSSLNFANRTKKIEVREVENEPVFKGPPRPSAQVGGPTIQRQPLRPLTNGINVNLAANRDAVTKNDKPLKAFSVYSDRNKGQMSRPAPQKSSPLKRTADASFLTSTRPSKISRPTPNFIRPAPESQPAMDQASIESLVEKKVSEIMAARALNVPDPQPAKAITDEVQRRLDSIEKRLEGQDGERAEGLSFLLMAKQHQARGEDGSALKMYELAQPHFPDNDKLKSKIERLKERLATKKNEGSALLAKVEEIPTSSREMEEENVYHANNEDESYHDANESARHYSEDDDESGHRARPKKQSKAQKRKPRASSPDPLASHGPESAAAVTPRTRYLLDIINSRDVAQIKRLNGLGAKRAEGIVDYLNEQAEEASEQMMVQSWNDLSRLRGIGKKTLETMREGVMV